MTSSDNNRPGEVREAAIRAALCLSGYIGEGIFVEGHEYPEDVYDNICASLGMPNADDDDLRAALTQQEKTDAE